MVKLDAILLATEATAQVRVAGLPAHERARRVATKVGASRVFVVEKLEQLRELAAWRGDSTQPLLVINANQFVHTGLVAGLIEVLPRSGAAVAVVPDAPAVGDLTVGAYAGAFVAVGDVARDVVATLVAGAADDNAVVAKLVD